MPRSPRTEFAGQVVHVASRGVARQAIYRDDCDRSEFLALLGEVGSATRWRCLTYCLMGNHYHLLLELREANLSEGMQSLNGEYARRFNLRHDRSGHLFQGRFWSRPVTRELHLFALARYVALNPVQARLCRAAADWPWSAHAALTGRAGAGLVDVARLLSYFDSDLDRARRAYSVLVNQHGLAKVDAGLRGLLATADRDEAIAHAYHECGQGVTEIAAALGCHPRTAERRIAAIRDKGV